ncbi:PQQ-dependent sugar dehydrogenase [Thalassobaculum sp. OXR-137]|uniref:PQQ-dependent sugar dehydrogenase n=1 Tax=Thalassobaculum sp. OXR-137 TaxID=3100173 RepID=UPI002AC92285|nr:PQQ-dependent sugar dehydrogenase [Thalassobaculum sp. OXR-137]WPZ32515.1 PQQ-dependent sugar dehydrogenase [Thalassobaculum sp. OXR-137]
MLPTRSLLLALPLLAALPGLADAQETERAQACALTAETRVSDLAHPWGVTFLPDGMTVITERDGVLWLADPSTGSKSEIAGAPRVRAAGQGGLLDVVAHPDFAQNRRLYFSYSEPRSDGLTGTAIAHGTLSSDGSRLSEVTQIFSMAPATNTTRHFGSRIVFKGDGTLWFTIGDRGDRPRAQNPDDHAGSVLRIAEDGSIPTDNPFADGRGGARELWSFGHRNAQGAARHPETGALWIVEHGARGGDEINRPEAGKNYGWPTISYGRHYHGGQIGVGTSADGMEQPVYYWDPSIAPSGLAFVQGDLFPAWRGDLLVGALKDRMLVRLDMENGDVAAEERLFKGRFGRVRDVRMGPDGAIWLLTDESDGALIRIAPADGVCG